MSAGFNELIGYYYSNKYPYQLIFDWLNYRLGNQDLFRLREFSFTLPGDIYVRYQAFENAIEYRNALVRKQPVKIDIGAIYNMSPKLARSYPNDFLPQQHELVFDIDISDYDDVRNCCKGTSICSKCWPFMKIGAKVLHTILSNEFGFKHILFVFSGRRGFHCWVCDEEARKLSTEARKAIVEYFSVVVGGQAMVKRVHLNPYQQIHPMICKALKIIDEDFDDLMINKQDFLAEDHLVQAVLDLCDDKSNLHSRLSDQCRFNAQSSHDRWAIMKEISDRYKGNRSKMNYFIQEVKLQHCFPRLDANVTKGLNHLLKMPFCIHPKTGNLCVPIDIEDINKFDLEHVPNLKDLKSEQLDPYIRLMENFVNQLKS